MTDKTLTNYLGLIITETVIPSGTDTVIPYWLLPTDLKQMIARFGGQKEENK